MSKELTKMIEGINTELRALGREAIQEIKMMKNGQVIGQVRYGYKPQYVFDAVNSNLLPENWRYEVISKEIFDKQVVSEVRLFIRVKDTEWICKGLLKAVYHSGNTRKPSSTKSNQPKPQNANQS